MGKEEEQIRDVCLQPDNDSIGYSKYEYDHHIAEPINIGKLMNILTKYLSWESYRR